jgi:hypothetical protein
MTPTEIALIIAASGTVINAITGALNLLVSRRGVKVSENNSQKLDSTIDVVLAVHESTNGLSQRNEAIARKLGVAEGTAAEKAHPT